MTGRNGSGTGDLAATTTAQVSGEWGGSMHLFDASTRRLCDLEPPPTTSPPRSAGKDALEEPLRIVI